MMVRHLVVNTSLALLHTPLTSNPGDTPVAVTVLDQDFAPAQPDYNKLTLQQYKELANQEYEQEWLEAPDVVLDKTIVKTRDPWTGEWEEDPERPRGPIHKWPRYERFGGYDHQEECVEMEV